MIWNRVVKVLQQGTVSGLLAMVLLSIPGMSWALDVIEFSAEAVQSAPERPEMRARMFVGKDVVRSEYEANGEPVVEIFFIKEQRRVMLLDKQKAYREQSGSELPSAVSKQSSGGNPCDGVANTTCKQLGREAVHGRSSVKWELNSTQGGQKGRTLMWLDELRMMPLRQIYPDGTVSELRLVKNEQLNGRNTEKWELMVTRTDGQTMSSNQWFDLELKIAVREEMAGGYMRELRNIQVGPQPPELFVIPQGYRKVTQQR